MLTLASIPIRKSDPSIEKTGEKVQSKDGRTGVEDWRCVDASNENMDKGEGIRSRKAQS